MINRELSVLEVRRANLRKLIPQWGGAVAIAMKLGHAGGAFITQMAGPNPSREISEKQARKIEARLDLQRGWLDMHHDDSESVIPVGLDESRLKLAVTEALLACVEAKVTLPAEKLSTVIVMIYTSDTNALSMKKYARNVVSLSA